LKGNNKSEVGRFSSRFCCDHYDFIDYLGHLEAALQDRRA